MKEIIEQCKECQVLEFIDTPLADTSSRMPSLTFSLLQKYGDNLQYTLAINDLYFDFMTPSLRSCKQRRNAIQHFCRRWFSYCLSTYSD